MLHLYLSTARMSDVCEEQLFKVVGSSSLNFSSRSELLPNSMNSDSIYGYVNILVERVRFE